MRTAAQFPPCPPLCPAVCDLSERSGYRDGWGCFYAILAVFSAANLKQDKGPEAVSPLPAHFCPQCGQFWGTGSGVGKTGLGTAKGTVDEKKPVFSGFSRVSYQQNLCVREEKQATYTVQNLCRITKE